jgi:hypothetical protein
MTLKNKEASEFKLRNAKPPKMTFASSKQQQQGQSCNAQQRQCTATVQQYNSTTVQQYNSTTVQQYNSTQQHLEHVPSTAGFFFDLSAMMKQACASRARHRSRSKFEW